MSRILAIDYGTKRTGLAFTPDGKIILSLKVINLENIKDANKRREETIKKIQQIVNEKSINKIVLGIPFLKNKTQSEFTNEVLEFKEDLQRKVNVPIITIDEIYSTQEAREMVQSIRSKRKEKKMKINTATAQLLLERFLNLM